MSVSTLKSDERVVLFDTAARRTARGWRVPIHGWVFEPEDSRVRKGLVARILRRTWGLQVTPENQAVFDERLGWFLTDNERAKRMRIVVGEHAVVVPPSGKNGHFRTEVTLPAESVERLRHGNTLRVVAPDAPNAPEARVHLLEPEGLCVVSDVDDTVKISDVSDRAKLIEHTFFLPFHAVPGMAEKYRSWAAEGASFHYVTSSPWQLYRPLHTFLEQAGFPRGTFSMRSIRLTDRTIRNLFKGGGDLKRGHVRALLEAFPGRRFVLLGDSVEEDPEMYAGLMREFPEQVIAVYIRNVTGEKRDSARFQEVFQGLPASSWKLFDDAAEVSAPEL